MYQVNIGDEILYYPSSRDAVIIDTNLDEEVGLAGEFTFRVPPTNPLYSQVTNGAIITILKDGDEYWRGEVKDVKIDFNKIANVYVLEDLAWLSDEFIAPQKITNQTYTQRFQSVIATYNSTRSAERQFVAGNILNVTPTNDCFWKTEHEWSILESIRERICRATNTTGYLRVRRVTNNGVTTRYIDILRLEDFGSSDQTIEFGYNLLDFVKESDFGNLTNVLTPYGDEKENILFDDYHERYQGTTITNAQSVSAYGRHAKAVVFDGVTDINTLNALAQSYLTRYCQPQLTMEVTAVDLSTIEDVDSIDLGNSVRVIARPFAVDQNLYLTKISRDIQNIDKNVITMSSYVSSGRSITSQINSTAEIVNEIPSTYSVLESAKKDALNLLLDETKGGHVIFEYDSSNSYIEAINICDAATIAASEKRWRWSQNGFGYMKRSGHRTETDPAWTSLEVAIDMFGRITASAITTGTMSAERIKGDTLTLGGNGNGNGVCVVNASDNSTEYARLDSNGLTAKRGYIGNGSSGWNIADSAIYNGVESVEGTSGKKGTYVGVDGIRSQGGSGNAAYVKIKDGKLDCNSNINCAGVVATTQITSDGGLAGRNFSVKEGSSEYAGVTGQITWSSGGSGYSLNIKNGIVIGIGQS